MGPYWPTACMLSCVHERIYTSRNMIDVRVKNLAMRVCIGYIICIVDEHCISRNIETEKIDGT